MVTVVGTLPHAAVGQTLRLAGAWTSHEKFGVQLVAARCEEITPRSHDALAAYLAGSALPGALLHDPPCLVSGTVGWLFCHDGRKLDHQPSCCCLNMSERHTAQL